MNGSSDAPKPGEPGHYGAGYGEEEAGSDRTAPPPELESDADAPAGLEPLDPRLDPNAPPSADRSSPA